MSTIKSYTDLEQSRNLINILPLSSADMYYILMPDGVYNHFPLTGRKTELAENTDIPCWSLAALLGVLQYPTLFQNGDEEWGCTAWIDTTKPYSISPKDNPVDACYELILKLNELNLL